MCVPSCFRHVRLFATLMDYSGATAYVKIDVPADWANAVDADTAVTENGPAKLVKMVDNILKPVSLMNGDSLPVSAFADHVDGTFEQGASAYEKRGVAVMVPEWNNETCAQCNKALSLVVRREASITSMAFT